MEDDLAENTIRVTHIKENKGDPESSKRNITSPLSVEVGMILSDDVLTLGCRDTTTANCAKCSSAFIITINYNIL